MRRSSSPAHVAVAALVSTIVATTLGLLPASAADDDVAAPLEEILSSRGIPGAQVVHRRAVEQQSYAYGVQSAATGEPVTESTVFQAASLSKVVGAYAVLTRVEAGLIDLDTPLWDYYESPRIAGDEAAKTVTARMVLDHTTGFPNWAGSVNDPTSELVSRTPPGLTFGYSGDGFFLLQQVVEHLEGASFADILEEEIFAPWGMDDTTLETRPEDASRTTVGHDAAGQPGGMSSYTRGNTAFTLLTSAQDYTTFLERAVIDGEGLSPELHAEWLSVQSDAVRSPQNPANGQIDWGLGIGLEHSVLGDAVWHWGDNGSHKAFFMALPERDESVAMFWNSANGQKSAESILRLFYGGNAYHALTWVGDLDAPDRPAATIPTSDPWEELSTAIRPIIGEAAADGIDVAVAIEGLAGENDGRALYLGRQQQLTTASTIKLSLAATVMHQVELGALDLDDVVTITAEDAYGGSGVLKDRPFPQQVTVGEMLDLMITVSDNTATNMLVDVVGGFTAINALTETAGIAPGDLHFGRKMFGPVEPPAGDVWLSPYGINQLLVLLYDIADGEVAAPGFLSQDSARHIIDLMLEQQVKTKLGATIPADVLAHKTGENDTVSHDVGLVLVPGSELALSVLGAAQPGFDGDIQESANPHVQRIGTVVLDYLAGVDPGGEPVETGVPSEEPVETGVPSEEPAETEGGNAPSGASDALPATGAPLAAFVAAALVLAVAGVLVVRRRASY